MLIWPTEWDSKILKYIILNTTIDHINKTGSSRTSINYIFIYL